MTREDNFFNLLKILIRGGACQYAPAYTLQFIDKHSWIDEILVDKADDLLIRMYSLPE